MREDFSFVVSLFLIPVAKLIISILRGFRGTTVGTRKVGIKFKER